MAVTEVHKNWGLFYFNFELNFRHAYCDKGRTSIQQYNLEFQLPGFAMNEWILMNLKNPQGNFFYFPPHGKWRYEVSHQAPPTPGVEEEAPLSIFRIPVFCMKFRRRYQSHFEALGASFACERCETPPTWLCQFFKTHLQQTHQALYLHCLKFLLKGYLARPITMPPFHRATPRKQ